MKLNKQKIMLYMARLGMGQAALAARSGISKTSISYIVNGKSCNPATAGKIALALAVDVTDIMED